MEKLTVISHIFNEEYLLPFWLEYHSSIFDYGIIIDYFSTDNSVKIINKFCPHWKVIQTKNVNANGTPNFDARLTDSEVNEVEKTIKDGYKICLNTTELLFFGNSKEEFINSLSYKLYYHVPAYSIMSKNQNNQYFPKNTIDFFQNISYNPNSDRSCRILHSDSSINYTTGRHSHTIGNSHTNIYNINAFILWCGFYSINNEMIKRRLQIQHNIPQTDRDMGFGYHHFIDNNQFITQYTQNIQNYIDIPENIVKIINERCSKLHILSSESCSVPTKAGDVDLWLPTLSALEMQNSVNPIAVNDKKWKKREICRLCNSYNIFPFFNLEPTPPANHFVSNPILQEVIPLDICICQDCNHIQLLEIVDPGYQYSNYFYVSSTSNTMTTHLKQSVIKFTQLLNIRKTDHILEIGANDGVCVKELLDNGFLNIIGIDPASNINKRHKLPIICDFFGSNILDKLNNKYKLIYAFHCCAHIENIQDVFQTIYTLLDDDGSFIMEVGYFYEVFKNKLFDVIYHEHIDYHTVTAIQSFAKRMNLLLYKVAENSIQGGSIQFFFCKNSCNKVIDNSVTEAIEKENIIQLFNKPHLDKWQNIIIQNGKDINYILNSFVSYGKKVVGYGASAKSTTFLYQYNLSSKTVEYIIDDSIFKQNFYTPGLHIPIKSSNMLDIDKIDYIIILSWNFTDEILLKLDKYRKNGLRIIVPFPEIRII